MATLELTDVERHFGPVRALDGMSFDVADGEFFCILGPSSSGKTTTLRAIAGLEKLAGGRIVMDGRDITDAPVQGRDMAMIFQTFALYPHLTIRQNLAYPLKRAGIGGAETRRRVGEIAELLRVVHTLDRKPPTLSGGEQQRVAIGRAIVRRPKLLLLDEPLTNLDAKLRHDMRAEFKRLHRELGTTMLYATPDQLEAPTMGQRVAVIENGRVVQIDTPRALYARPADRYVAGMVGAPAMNLIDGRTRSEGSNTVVDLPFGKVDASGLGVPAGQDVVFGIRPHDITLAATSPDDGGMTLRAKVHLTEPLGDVTVIDLDVRGTTLKMVLREEVAARLKTGEDLSIRLGGADGHLFMKETGVRIA